MVFVVGWECHRSSALSLLPSLLQCDITYRAAWEDPDVRSRDIFCCASSSGKVVDLTLQCQWVQNVIADDRWNGEVQAFHTRGVLFTEPVVFEVPHMYTKARLVPSPFQNLAHNHCRSEFCWPIEAPRYQIRQVQAQPFNP